MTTQINDVRQFLQGCDQDTVRFSMRQAALYTGLQLEELSEKLAVLGLTPWAEHLDRIGDAFKRGDYDGKFAELSVDSRAGLLDADLDLLWVSAGAALSLGADVDLGWNLLTENNMAKIDPVTGKARRNPETGKIMKPEGHKPPDFKLCF